mmetsp:Transcript_12967/g.16829  ORF Transcript_12967/g.16829 Transcript_12967/m.16829 type:complete len:700 (-) Transcript_12967:357-2456(-)|eukprot:CAMPEP_0204864874 /NCGR_PEP_ID=MMETSP1348-20121228/4393_1 /ASSEMBLY_ACC=CAM_ASM_000700 /TAXON_ID=215587 /ORGANISM="Aplanochytrium stocchinoi, Strain GSBS06" /LENGTH=699 /DNA_ID=CAMNT_0052015675 /DNA_START=62 /DNA_END=2164 /DNA_ORIENTATION=+
MPNFFQKLREQGRSKTPLDESRVYSPRPPPPRPKPKGPEPPSVDQPDYDSDQEEERQVRVSVQRGVAAPQPGRGTLMRVKKKREMMARPPTTGKSSVKLVPQSIKVSGKEATNPFSPLSEILRNQGLGKEGTIGYHCLTCRRELIGPGTLEEATLFKCLDCSTISSSLCAARVRPHENNADRWFPDVQDDGCIHWIRTLSNQEEKQLLQKLEDLEKLQVDEIEDILDRECDADPDKLPTLFPDRRKHELIQYIVAYQEFTSPYRIKDGYVRETMGNGDIHWSRIGQSRSEIKGIPEHGLEIDHNELKDVISCSFEERSGWFRDQLEKMRWVDEYEGPIRITVNREHLLEESSNYVNALHGLDRWRTARYEFFGELAMDSGGVAKEWYRLVCDSVFKPEYGLFERSDLDDVTYDFNPSSELFQPERHMHYYRFAGRILAKAIFEGCFVDAHLTKIIYKHILGRPCSLEDLELYDKSLHRSIQHILDNIEHVEELDLAFSIGTTVMGAHTEVELKEGGAELYVTKDNLGDYIKLFLKYYFFERGQDQLSTFLKGFHEIIPQSLLCVFNEEEFEQIMCGTTEIDVEDWKNNVTYRREFKEQGAEHPVIVWFWQVLHELNDQEKSKLLQFITGSSRVPIGGFAGFDSGSSMLISIESIDQSISVFPRAHTCFNRMELPLYDSKEELENRVRFVLEFTNGFNLE